MGFTMKFGLPYSTWWWTHHDGDVVPVVVGQRAVAAQDEVLCPHEHVQVARVVAHHLGHMVQPVVLQKRVYQ